jgi:hypothetical protein
MLSVTDPSSQCYTDTQALAQTVMSGTAAVALSCPQALIKSGNSFTTDYSVCDPDFTNSLTEVCTAAGGE